MSHLKNYVDSLNAITAIFDGEDPVNIDVNNLDNATAQQLFNYLANELSPENLTCDGELPFAAVQKKAKMLNGAAAELLAKGYRPKDQYTAHALQF